MALDYRGSIADNVAMHIDVVPNRGSEPAVLLRESYREGKKVRKRTLANLSSLPMEQIQTLRRLLRGERLVAAGDLFEITQSRQHGAVQAILMAMSGLGFDELIASRPSRERRLVKAMVAARVLDPQSKLATARSWGTTTLPEELGILDATEDELYEAMDWLLQRQNRIEKRLAVRHLDEESLVLYDLSSTYFEGKTCPLAALGHNRDGKKGKLQVNFGLVTNRDGCPVGVSVHPGETGDPKTLLPQLRRIREVFGVHRVVMVGDRGMISQKQIDVFIEDGSVDWISALRSVSIAKLHESGALQMGLFDKRNLFELTHPDYPHERLIACRNEALAKLRAHKRTELIEATRRELDRIATRVESGRLEGRAKIGLAAGRVVNRYKVAKHFQLHIEDRQMHYEIRSARVAAESALDGVYVIRTSVPQEKLNADDAVRSYKRLTEVERAFRSMKTIDIKVRPVHHRLADRVRSHIFLCMLAYYVEWHLVNAWRPLLFADEDQEAKQARDPVAPARRSAGAQAKAASQVLADGSPVHSFRTLLKDLAGVVRNRCHRKGAPAEEATFDLTTVPSEHQRRALELAATIHV
jgi:transposase